MSEHAAAEIVRLLREKGWHLATAESCTGGMLSAAITSVSGSSEVFDFGAVTYSNEFKQRLLGVNADTLAQYGAVSLQTAKQMAEGIMAYAGADIGVGITGIAGPSSDNTNKPVGLIFIGLAKKDAETIVIQLNNHFEDNVREKNRQAAVDAALGLLAEQLR